MKENNKIDKYTKSNDSSKENVSLEYALELERKDHEYLDDKGYDFIPRAYHLTNIDEQRLKVEEIEKKTENRKD